jgi:hypothetical protein
MRTNQSGATIAVVICVVAVLAVFTGAALDYTFTVSKNVERSNKMAACTAIANGCIQEEFMYWREISRSYATQGPPTSAFSGISLPTASQFPSVSNFTATTGTSTSYLVSNYKIEALTPQLQPVASGTAAPALGLSGSNMTYFYRATATVSMPDRGPNVTVNAAQVFEQQYQNPWDWAIFFLDPLEIHPGADFTIDGWVQTNTSLWTGYSDLTFGDKVTYGTTWTIGFMPNDGDHTGVTPATPSWPTGLPPEQGTPTSDPFGLNTALFNDSDSNPNNNGYYELIQVPNPSYTDPLASERYFDNAGVKVLLNTGANSIVATVYDNSAEPTVTSGVTSLGTTIGVATYNTTTQAITTSGTGSDSAYQVALYKTMKSALTFNQSIQDDRQNATVTLTELNVGTLATAIDSGGSLYTYANNGTFNQVVYITDQSASSSNERAVELTNGATLPTNGLTIASGNPVYIQGDYNTGGVPPSDSSSTGNPQVTGYTRQPSSIVADAVDILSDSWSNSNSTNSMSSRVATSTTVNSAIMAGTVPTGSNGDNYSGGAENFPRFLEDWSNATLTYYGSMVELFSSQQATGIWGNGNVYNPPTRNWHYDTDFDAHPPPGSVMVVSYLKGQWYTY